jgi:hypothetical protein
MKQKDRYPFIRCFEDPLTTLLTAHADLVLFLDASDMLTNSALEDMCIAHVQSGGAYIYADTLNLHGEHTVQPDYHQNLWYVTQHQTAALIPTAWAREVEPWHSWREFYMALAVGGHCGQHLGRALIIREDVKESLTSRDVKRLRKYEGVDMACCGGQGGDAILAAKAALAGMMAAPIKPGNARLEYIGDNVGAISFFGKGGVEYRGGNNDMERFVDVNEVDVDRLVSTGRWAISLMVKQAIPTINSVTPIQGLSVKMIYTGSGTIDLPSSRGGMYHAGRQNELIDIDERDVARLIGTELFEVYAETRTPEPELVAVSMPDVIEVTAEDEAVNKMIEQSRKAQAKKGKR